MTDQEFYDELIEIINRDDHEKLREILRVYAPKFERMAYLVTLKKNPRPATLGQHAFTRGSIKCLAEILMVKLFFTKKSLIKKNNTPHKI